jgi:hypothetical protein
MLAQQVTAALLLIHSLLLFGGMQHLSHAWYVWYGEFGLLKQWKGTTTPPINQPDDC